MNNFLLIGLTLLELAFIVRVMLRLHRDPASRLAWIAVIAVVPVPGIIAYIMFGETSIGRRRSARQHVHLLFYIWLTDINGCKITEALKRAAGRGVNCRAMADGLGSRALINSSSSSTSVVYCTLNRSLSMMKSP